MDEKPYHFIKEVIKKKPLNKRALLLKIAAIAAAAVAAGIIVGLRVCQNGACCGRAGGDGKPAAGEHPVR